MPTEPVPSERATTGEVTRTGDRARDAPVQAARPGCPCARMPRGSDTGVCSSARAPYVLTTSPRGAEASFLFSPLLVRSQWPPSAVCDNSEVPRWLWIY